MKILQINISDLGGGAQVISSKLASHYTAQGHDCVTAVGWKYGDRPDVVEIPNRERRPRRARAAARVATALRRIEHGYTHAAADAIELAAEPRRARSVWRGEEDFAFPGTANVVEMAHDADVVHAHNLHGGYFDLRLLPELTRAAPTLLTLHDAWLMTGHCAHSFDWDGWRTGCGNCPYLSTYPAIRRDATAFNWERKRGIYERSRFYVAAPSAWLLERTPISILAAGTVERRVIPNGVELDVFRPGDRHAARGELGIPEEAGVVLFVANWTKANPFKDYELMESTIARLGQEERPVVFLCVGQDAEPQTLGSAEIRFFGHQGAPAAIARFYRAADVYLHAARADTFPNTVLEALASGLPVVATAVGGIPEQVEEGRTGYLVEGRDAEALAARVSRVLDDSGLRDTLGAAAAASAAERFDFRRTGDAYLAWLEEIAERDRSPSAASRSSTSSSMRSA